MSLLASLRAFLHRRRRWLYAAGGVVALYAAFGFLLLPRILRPKLEKALAEALHRETRIAALRVNPFVLSVTLDGLEIHGRHGGEWVRCERIYANAQLFPLLRKTLELKELDIVAPSVQLELDEQGRPDFADLLEGGSKPEAAKPAASPWTLALDHFELSRGRVPFLDCSTTPDFRTVLGPLDLRLEGLRTQLGAKGDYAFEAFTDAGERLAWSGRLELEPFACSGRLELEHLDLPRYAPYLKPVLELELRSGRLSFGADYRVAWNPSEKAVLLSNGDLRLENAAIAEPGAAPAIQAPRLQASGISLDLLANRVRVARIAGSDGAMELERSKEGLNFARLFGPPPGVKPRPKDPDAKPLDLRIEELGLDRFRFAWADRTMPRPLRVELHDLRLGMKGFSLDRAQEAQAQLDAAVGEKGRLSLAGPIKPLGFAMEVKAEAQDLDLPTFDPYLAPATDLRLFKGRLGLSGKLRLSFLGKKNDGLGYAGDVSVQDFEAADGRDKEVLLRWKQLRLAGLDTATAPLALKLKSLDWSGPEARLVVAADGTNNVSRALKLAPETQPVAAAVVQPTPRPEENPMKLDIGLMAVKGGRLSFVDRSISPRAALLLDQLEGSYKRLSTDPASVSEVDFRGKAGGLAPVTITGKAMPFRTDKDTDVQLKIEGADLLDFNPYAMKYLGRGIQKGKLDVDSRLRIQQRQLNALAKAKLDQFYLGDKVDSPEATKLPVKLALALLRDRRGVIDLEVPIDGSLDDPDVHYGKMVWKAILNVLGKAATSPFRLLGGLFGGGEDLSFAAFAPGQGAVDADARKKLAALAKSLTERPELTLELEGAADPAVDGPALKRAALDRRIREQAGDAPTPAQREAAVRSLFLAAIPRDPKAPKAPEPPAAEMEQRLLGAMPEDPDALAALAAARTKATLAALLELQAPADRVFPVQGTLDEAQSKQGRVWFAVK